MAATKLNGALQIRAGSLVRSLINTLTSGSAVIAKVIAGTNIAITQTGIDNGTGDVTINALNYSIRRTIADVNDTVSAVAPIDQFLAFTSLTASRAIALCGASSYPAGSLLYIKDESGNCSSTNTIIINRTGSDLINGQTSITISSSYGGIILTSNGTNAWTYLSTNSSGAVSGATGSDILVATDTTKFVNAKSMNDAITPTILTYASTVNPNMNLGSNFSVTATGSLQIGLPVNLTGKEGRVFTIDIYQDGTGSRAITFHSSYDFGVTGVPTASTNPYKWDRLYCRVINGTTGGFSTVSTSANAISGGDGSSNPKANAFDNNVSTSWLSSQTYTGISGNAYIGQDFGSSTTIAPTRVVVTNDANGSVDMVSSMLFQYADTATGTWVTFQTFTMTVANNAVQVFPITGAPAKRCWRLLANGNLANSGYSMGIAELAIQISIPQIDASYKNGA